LDYCAIIDALPLFLPVWVGGTFGKLICILKLTFLTFMLSTFVAFFIYFVESVANVGNDVGFVS
jgi:hypothetical protein